MARYKALQAGNALDGPARVAELRAIMADLDKAISLSPRMAFAYFNKGNLLAETGDLTSALLAYNKAIELKPDLGEAYYNRGGMSISISEIMTAVWRISPKPANLVLCRPIICLNE